MTKSLPSPKNLRNAWDLCQRARHPHVVEAELLVLALLYGAGLGAARIVTTMAEGADANHVRTARLFAALQVKLGREPDCLERVPPEWVQLLLDSLPLTWVSTLKARLASSVPTFALSATCGASSDRVRPKQLLSLADMVTVGRA